MADRSTRRAKTLPIMVLLAALPASLVFAQEGGVDLVRSAEEKSRVFTAALWCVAVFRAEKMGFEETMALDELRPLAPTFGHDTEDELIGAVEQTMQQITRGDMYGPPLSYDEFEDLRTECIARYLND